MSARTKNNHAKNQHHNKVPTADFPKTGGIPVSPGPKLQRARGLIQQGDYIGAADFLASAGHSPQVRNALGVCLMRTGYVDKAVDVFRSFVLIPGTVQERTDVSNASRRNFATALLMKGFPSGALAVLAEIHDSDHPMAVRLYAAIKQWEKTLSWFRRLDWKLNGIEPKNCQVQLDFEPGEFEFDVQIPHSIESCKPSVVPLLGATS